MPGSVRGTFDLDARPASSALRSLREEGTATDAVMARLGATLDKVGTVRQQEQVRTYSSKVADLRGELEGAYAAGDLLQERLDALGRGTTTISVNLTGFDEALGQVTILEDRLNALDRTRATASVGVRGSAAATAQTAATRAAVSTLGGGRGGVRSPLPSAGSLLGRLPLGGGVGLTSILGFGTPLVGGAGALLGSAGAGALGAGATGAAGFGALGAALGMTAGVALPAAKAIGTAHTALLNFQKQVEEFGSSSTQAKTALSALNATLASAPGGTGKLLSTEQSFVQRWQRTTAPAQSDFMGILTRLLGTGRQLTPLLSTQTNRFFGAASNQTDAFGNFLTSTRSRQTIRSLGGSATGNLDELRRTTDHVFRTLGNIMIAARPFFHEAMVWLDDWTSGWARGTHDIGHTRSEIGKMVDQFKLWARLFGAAARLSGDVLGAGAKPGGSMVGDLTNTLDRWDRFINQNPGKVRGFFKESVDSTERIAGALGHIVDLLFRLGRLLQPIVTQISNLASLGASLGPGGIPLLLAGYGGIRRGVGSVLTPKGAPPTTGGTVPMVIPGAPMMSPTTQRPMTAAEAAIQPGETAGMQAERVFGQPGVTPWSQAAGLQQLEAMNASRASSLAGRFPRTAGLLGRARTFGSSTLGGFARYYLPGAAAYGGLVGASTPGGLANQIQGAVSAIIPGVPAPRTAAQIAAGERRSLLPAKGPGGIFGLGGLPRVQASGVGGHLTELGSAFGIGGGLGLTPQAQAYQTTVQQLQTLQKQAPRTAGGFHQIERAAGEALAEGRKFGLDTTIVHQLQSIRQSARSARGQLQSSVGQRAFSDVEKAFGIRTAHGQSLSDAFSAMTSDISDKADKLHGKTRASFSKMAVDWLESFKKAHKGMAGQTDAAIQDVLQTLQKGHDRWKLINGNLVDITQTSWKSISKAMGSNAEQAREEVSKAFTTLQQEVIAKLHAMGVPASVARSVTNQQEFASQQGAKSRAAIATGTGVYQKTAASSGKHHAFGGRLAAGGRIPGHPIYGRNDAIPLSDGSIGAGGELIVNRHTERRVNRMLGVAGFGTSLGGMVKGEQRPHGGPSQEVGRNAAEKRGYAAYRRFRQKNPKHRARGGRGGNPVAAAHGAHGAHGGSTASVYPLPIPVNGRVDMGVDFAGTGPVVAMGDAKVLSTSNYFAGFGAPSWGLVYELLGGAPEGISPSTDTIYHYEGIHPSVHVGETVRAGQRVGSLVPPPASSEIGFAVSGGQAALASPHYSEGQVTAEGTAMRKLLDRLRAGGQLAGGGAGMAGGGGATPPPQISLRNPMHGGSGLLGVGTTAAGGTLARGMQSAVNKKLRKHAGATRGARGGANVGNLPPSLQKYNYRWTKHWAPDFGGPTMPVNKIAELAEWAGMPGVTMAQVAHGESGYRPGSGGTDPGGTKGYGLWAITSPFHPEVSKYGGYEAMLNPILNALVAAGEYKSSGLSGWYGTRYLTSRNAHYSGPMNARGGRISAAHGANFWANRPMDLRVGDGGVPEHVSVTPINHRTARRRLGQGGPTISLGDFHFHGPIGTSSGDAKKLAKQVGKHVADEITKALDGSSVDDSVLG